MFPTFSLSVALPLGSLNMKANMVTVGTGKLPAVAKAGPVPVSVVSEVHWLRLLLQGKGKAG